MAAFRYQIYGFCVASDLDFPGFPETDQPVDVRIACLRTISKTSQIDHFGGDREEMVLDLAGLGIFTVRQGTDIIVEPCAGADMDLVRSYLLGTVLGALLYQRGFLILHSSCVSIQGRACLFAGQIGAGKSTFACHLLKAGGKLLSDDITAIKMDGGIPMVQPGFPMMRLAPELAGGILDANPRTMDKQVAKFGKKCYLIEPFFEKERTPLKAICLLQFGAERKFEKISGSQALFQCLPHLFVDFIRPEKHAPIFLKLAALLQHAEACHFYRVPGHDNIPGDCAALMEHMSQDHEFAAR